MSSKRIAVTVRHRDGKLWIAHLDDVTSTMALLNFGIAGRRYVRLAGTRPGTFRRNAMRDWSIDSETVERLRALAEKDAT